VRKGKPFSEHACSGGPGENRSGGRHSRGRPKKRERKKKVLHQRRKKGTYLGRGADRSGMVSSQEGAQQKKKGLTETNKLKRENVSRYRPCSGGEGRRNQKRILIEKKLKGGSSHSYSVGETE